MLMLFYLDWFSGLSLPAATSVLGLNAITELNCLTYDRDYVALATNNSLFSTACSNEKKMACACSHPLQLVKYLHDI